MPELESIAELEIPKSIKISEWAILGGMVGYPALVGFNGFEAPILAEVLGQFGRWVGKESVLSVSSKRDLTRLRDERSNIRLVLLFDDRLLPDLAWQLETDRKLEADGESPSPAVLFQQSLSHSDTPGPIITVLGASPEHAVLEHWLADGPPFPLSPFRNVAAKVSFCGDDSLWNRGSYRRMLRRRQIARSLLVGAALSGQLDVDQSHISLDQRAYKAVFDILNWRHIQTADEYKNPLALFMAQRSTIFLEMKRSKLKGTNDTSSFEETHGEWYGLITRREVADLGNINSTAIKDLVEFIRKDHDNGMQNFKACGLVRTDVADWANLDVVTCCKLLLPWSPKQVRSVFHRLYQDRFISAVQTSSNQPWIYKLPESFASLTDSLVAPPPPTQLTFPLGRILFHKPTCPPPAQPDGQTEVLP